MPGHIDVCTMQLHCTMPRHTAVPLYTAKCIYKHKPDGRHVCTYSECSVHYQQVLIPGPSGQSASRSFAIAVRADARRPTHTVKRVSVGMVTNYVREMQRQIQTVLILVCLDFLFLLVFWRALLVFFKLQKKVLDL